MDTFEKPAVPDERRTVGLINDTNDKSSKTSLQRKGTFIPIDQDYAIGVPERYLA